MKRQAQIVVFLLLSVLHTSYGQASPDSFDLSASLNWIPGEITAQASFDLVEAGIRLPTGRFMAEDILKETFPLLLRPYLLSIRVDSNSVIQDLIDEGELSFEDLDIICEEAAKIPPSLSTDLRRMSGRSIILLEKLSSLLIRHRRAIEPTRPIVPVQAADYTGIIIIADRELPIHGRRAQALAEPCIFPKIWDTNMDLVYERNMTDPGRKEGTMIVRYTTPESIFRPVPSGLDGELAIFLGPNPLRIFAREVFGISPTDLVIDREDALKILSTENNRRLIREGRIALVLNESQLVHTMR